MTGRLLELSIQLPPDLVEEIAVRAAEILEERLRKPDAPTYFSVPEAADYIRAKPHRVYDLLSARRLTRYKDGARVLVSREELDRYLAANATEAYDLPGTRNGRALR